MQPLTVTRKSLSQEDADAVLEATCEIITSAIQPKKVIAFGSSVDGGFSDQSDIDLIIVCDDLKHLKESRRALLPHRPLSKDVPMDLIWMTAADFDRKSEQGGVAYVAKHEGRVLYERSL